MINNSETFTTNSISHQRQKIASFSIDNVVVRPARVNLASFDT